MQTTALVSKTKNEMMVSENRISDGLRYPFGIPSGYQRPFPLTPLDT